MTELHAAYEDEMDERYSVRSDAEYERQHHQEIHAERLALFRAQLSHTPFGGDVIFSTTNKETQ